MTIGYSFQSLHSDNGFRVVFRGIVGSRAYGTNRPGSDEDVRGVFLVPSAEYALLTTPAPSFRKSLRNPHINYRNGWFFVTSQVAHNEYVLRHADEIWVGDISPNGMLNAMIRGLKVTP